MSATCGRTSVWRWTSENVKVACRLGIFETRVDARMSSALAASIQMIAAASGTGAFRTVSSNAFITGQLRRRRQRGGGPVERAEQIAVRRVAIRADRRAIAAGDR